MERYCKFVLLSRNSNHNLVLRLLSFLIVEYYLMDFLLFHHLWFYMIYKLNNFTFHIKFLNFVTFDINFLYITIKLNFESVKLVLNPNFCNRLDFAKYYSSSVSITFCMSLFSLSFSCFNFYNCASNLNLSIFLWVRIGVGL